MATKYAAGTTVPVNRSKADLEKICIKYGAKNFSVLQNEVMDYELLFQPYTVLPDNTIIGHRISKQIGQLYAGDTAHDLLGNNI